MNRVLTEDQYLAIERADRTAKQADRHRLLLRTRANWLQAMWRDRTQGERVGGRHR